MKAAQKSSGTSLPALSRREKKAVAAAVSLGLSIQHKFRPEPLYKHTGRGYMESDGVAELSHLKRKVARAKTVAG